MESIYFEKQEGSLCAQHCLNSLLQGQYFTAVDLAKIARDLDEEEKQRMAELGEDTPEYQRFLQQPSVNMDDSGYFSVQVITRCLGIWELELFRYGSTDTEAQAAKQNPAGEKAYICNYNDHWFTIRKLASQWFNLNSLIKGPKLISNTFLALYLAQLQEEGYSIFIVQGDFPQCEADRTLLPQPTAKLGTVAPPSSPSHIPFEEIDQVETQEAIFLSYQSGVEDEDEDLKTAIELSLSTSSNSRLNGMSEVAGSSEDDGARGGFEEMDADLEAAVRLSMECAERA